MEALGQSQYGGTVEVIIVVDGSTDGTAEALAQLQLPFPLHVIEQPNRGAAHARNRAAAEAKNDVLLFLDHGVPPSTVVTARLIGVLEIRQRSEDEPKWKRNDRFLAVATHAHGHQHLKALDDLRPHLLDEVESFFSTYAGLEGKQLEMLARKGPRRAEKLIKAGARQFGRKR